MKVTIITVCKNAAKSIKKTIASVRSQSYTDIEYIVVDGMSSDDTYGILQNNKDLISALIREKDAGVYHAMNKGIKKSTGDILFFLNTGDVFANHRVVENIVGVCLNNPVDIVYGDAIVGKHIKMHNQWLPYYLYKNTITHQAIFAKRRLFEKYGRFDETYLVLADLEWEVRTLIRNHIPCRYIPMPVADYQPGGLSDAADKKSIALRLHERNRIRYTYYPAWQRVLFQGVLGVEYAVNEIKAPFIKRRGLHQR